MSFIPSNYIEPKNSLNYFKIQEGENIIRIMSRPIMGWEDWTMERKPVRFEFNEKPQKSIDPAKPIKLFWAFIIYNVLEHRIQIMQVTQATIRQAIESLCKDSEWGEPYHYNIKIMRTGEGKESKYNINPSPHRPLDEKTIQMFKETPIKLEALFTNEDPFAKTWKSYTPMAIEEIPMQKPKESVSNEDIARLMEILDQDLAYKEKVVSRIKDLCGDDLANINKDLYKIVYESAKERLNVA